MFQHVLHRQLSMETIMDLDTIAEINEPPANMYKFSNEIKDGIKNTSKLYGITPEDISLDYPAGQEIFYSVLFNALVHSYNPDINGEFDGEKIKKELAPRKFIVGSDENPLKFVGGSRQGELDGFNFSEIEEVFGQPTYEGPSQDNKVQLEWDIKFDNGVRATIYDYKQYDKDPYEEVKLLEYRW